jgi:Fic family protein
MGFCGEKTIYSPHIMRRLASHNKKIFFKIAKCSTDTALRDIQDLIQKTILQKEAAGGRSTNYELIIPVNK